MPYIRQITGHSSEARRQKLDPAIKKVVNRLLLFFKRESVDPSVIFFDCVKHLCYEWTDLFTARQSKPRYYNFNDIGGVAVNAIWEMMRRMEFSCETFPHWSTIADRKSERLTGLGKLVRPLVALFDVDRGEAVGECNYVLSEIALALINAGKLKKEDAVQSMYAAAQFFYQGPVAAYEDASIIDPGKGDTAGYLEYAGKHVRKK